MTRITAVVPDRVRRRAFLAANTMAGTAPASKPAPTAGQGGFNWLHIVVFAAVVSLTIWVIYDLEMPRYELIRIDNYDQTLLDLRDNFRRGP